MSAQPARSRSRLATAAFVFSACAFTSSACSSGPGPVFIATDEDFAPFRSWERVALGDQPLSGHPPGPRFGYLNHRAPAGASAYPVGTIIVKTVEPSSDFTQWDVFAMVKRGGNFNAMGAKNWEFFRLKIDPGGTPYILSRGITAFDPSMDGGGYFGPVAGALADLCNSCHGTAASAATDHVLSPLLVPGK